MGEIDNLPYRRIPNYLFIYRPLQEVDLPLALECGLYSVTCFQRVDWLQSGKWGEGSNFTVEKPGKCYLSPVAKFNIIGDVMLILYAFGMM